MLHSKLTLNRFGSARPPSYRWNILGIVRRPLRASLTESRSLSLSLRQLDGGGGTVGTDRAFA